MFDDADDAGFERDSRAWCDHCGDSDFAENMGDYRVNGATLVLCARCAEREQALAAPNGMGRA